MTVVHFDSRSSDAGLSPRANVRPWMDDAACTDPEVRDLFVPDGRKNAAATAQAKQVCDSCPSQRPCLLDAYARPELAGESIRGGLTFEQRRRTKPSKS